MLVDFVVILYLDYVIVNVIRLFIFNEIIVNTPPAIIASL